MSPTPNPQELLHKDRSALASHKQASRDARPSTASADESHFLRSESVPDAASGKPSRSPDLCSSPSQKPTRNSVSSQRYQSSKTASRSDVYHSVPPRSPSIVPRSPQGAPDHPESACNMPQDIKPEPESHINMSPAKASGAEAAADAVNGAAAAVDITEAGRSSAAPRHAAAPEAAATQKQAPAWEAADTEVPRHQHPNDVRTAGGERGAMAGDDDSATVSDADEDASDSDAAGRRRRRFKGVHRPLWSAWCDAYAELPDLQGDGRKVRCAGDRHSLTLVSLKERTQNKSDQVHPHIHPHPSCNALWFAMVCYGVLSHAITQARVASPSAHPVSLEVPAVGL